MQVNILGDFSVCANGATVTPRAAKPRSILALLAIRRGDTVSKESIMREIWGEEPPKHALGTVHTYIYDLRKALASRRTRGAQILLTRPQGYMLDACGLQLDSTRFENLVREASTFAERGLRSPGSREALEKASEELSAALTLWRGSPLADVVLGEQLSGHVTWLEERRRQALELRLHVDMKLGRGPALIGELMLLTQEYPFHEGFSEMLMLALARAGRRSEALEVFHGLRSRLTSDLGLEPGPSVQRVQRALLGGDAERDAPQPAARRRSPRRRMRLAQLPPRVPDFCGRQEVLDDVETHLTEGGGTEPMVYLSGMAGVGKSALAIRVANDVAGCFPGGQLYVDVHHTAGDSVSLTTLPTKVLKALGVAEESVPTTPEECVGAIRSLVHERDLLLVIDGVQPQMSIERLLPTGCATVITGRAALHGVPGMKKVKIETFLTLEGLSLLEHIAGRNRIRTEACAAESLVDRVGALPLAVRFLGERLASSPVMTLEWFRENIDAAVEEGIRLSDLQRIGFDLFSRLDSMYRGLDDSSRVAFCALAPLRHGIFSIRDVAAELACEYSAADISLAGLVDAGLLRVKGFGRNGERMHILHVLVGLFALECSERSRRSQRLQLLAPFPRDEIDGTMTIGSLPGPRVPVGGDVDPDYAIGRSKLSAARTEPDGQRDRSGDPDPRAPRSRSVGLGVLQSGRQDGQCLAHLGPCERRAETVVRTTAEGELSRPASADVEVAVAEDTGVVVRCVEEHIYKGADRDSESTVDEVLTGNPYHRGRGRGSSHRLLHCRHREFRLVAERDPLLGMLQEHRHRHAQLVLCGILTGEQQPDHHDAELLRGQSVPGLFRGDQGGKKVWSRPCPTFGQ